jgi:hypothetical protein
LKNSCKFPISGDSNFWTSSLLKGKEGTFLKPFVCLRAQPLSTQCGHKKPWKSLKTIPYLTFGLPLQRSQGVFSHCGLAIYIKKYLIAKKKNYGNSNISPCKNILFPKSSTRNQNPSRYSNSI